MHIVKTLAAACLAALAVGATSAEALPKVQGGVGSAGSVLAPSGNPSGGQSQQTSLPTTFSPLTAQECEGLGGKVVFSLSCAAKGRFACTTVDPNGVVRSVCLTR